MEVLLADLIAARAAQRPDAVAVSSGPRSLTYAQLEASIDAVARGCVALGLRRLDRVAVYLPKRLETVCALFGASRAGGVFVPVNPLLKPDQVGHILRDCGARVLVTTEERAEALRSLLAACPELHAVVLVDAPVAEGPLGSATAVSWTTLGEAGGQTDAPRGIDLDMAAILYTSGSTGRPKGVVLSHRNLLAGAHSVASYLGNNPEDRILAVLPLSFDAGFSQLTTAFAAGAAVELLEYLLPQDVLRAASRARITGITAVPPLWIQLAGLAWPEPVRRSLRYVANTGGHMPRTTLETLRRALPATRVFLMYGLTEAFRATYLPPEELDRRPDSVGKAIPNVEVMVVREDGSPCVAGEPGELVQRGALVALGYWNDPERTAERFRPAPGQPAGIVRPEIAVWSGDTVRADEDGFLYFVGRKDDMIKTSGYRVSPTEIEEVAYAGGRVAEVAALGLPHPTLGQAVVLVAKPGDGFDAGQILDHCRRALPSFMWPLEIVVRDDLPRNPNGKIDRKRLATELGARFQPSEA